MHSNHVINYENSLLERFRKSVFIIDNPNPAYNQFRAAPE